MTYYKNGSWMFLKKNTGMARSLKGAQTSLRGKVMH